MNMLYEMVENTECDWQSLHEALINDPRIGDSHTNPLSSSRPGAVAGRGAGGHCLIKDFEAFRRMYKEHVPETAGDDVLLAMALLNKNLLTTTEKDIDLLKGVYGDDLQIT